MSRKAGISPSSRAPGADVASLVMTDYIFLGGVAVAWTLAILLDPLSTSPIAEPPFIRHLAGAMVLAACFLTSVASGPGHRLPKPGIINAFTPLLALGVFMFTGSLYARLVENIQETFLTAGLYIFLAPASAYLLARSRNPEKLLSHYMGILMIGAGVVIIQLALNYGIRQVHHELEYIVPSLGFLFLLAAPPRQRLVLGTVLLFSALLFRKNTGYLTLLMLLGYLGAYVVAARWKAMTSLQRLWLAWCGGMLLAALTLVVVYFILERDTYLPSGNTEFRFFTYQRAFERFLDSPVWGTGFTAAAAEHFVLFDTGLASNTLPTHSDILDIAANGGVVGIGLLVWALARVWRLSWNGALHPRLRHLPLSPYAQACAGIVFTAILTYAFNPIWLQPAKALILWTSTGLLIGIALLTVRDAPAPRTPAADRLAKLGSDGRVSGRADGPASLRNPSAAS